MPIVSILETRGPEVQGHPGLHSEFWASLGDMKPVWDEKNKKLRDWVPCLKANVLVSGAAGERNVTFW